MIPKLMRKPFRFISNLQVDHKQSNSSSASMAVGLGIILTQISSQGKKSSNIVVKSELSLRQKLSVASSLDQQQQQQQHSCFLKACHLCNKGLSLDKEVYMYRGDIGFCSEVCRDRQIVLDEMREMETSTKKVLAAYRRRSCRILEQHEKIPPRRTIFAL